MRPDLQRAVADALVGEGLLVRTPHGLISSTCDAVRAPADAEAWRRIDLALIAASCRPLTAKDLARSIGFDTRRIEIVLFQAAELGQVHFVSRWRVARTKDLRSLAGLVAQLASASGVGSVSVSDLRDASGIGWNMSVEVMEYFEKRHFTRRVDDDRWMSCRQIA